MVKHLAAIRQFLTFLLRWRGKRGCVPFIFFGFNLWINLLSEVQYLLSATILHTWLF